jgi:hypothetical protein
MVLLANAAWAQPTAADRKAIEACLERPEDNFGSRCIGIIADPCIKAAKREGPKSNACAARELAVWDAQMEAALKRVKVGGQEIGHAVTQSQQTWRSSLGTLCPVFDKIDPGMLPGGATYCRMQETANRALVLRRLGEAVNEH